MITYSGQLDEILELGMTEHFSRHSVFARVLDHTLGIAALIRLDSNDAWWEAIAELFLVFAGDG